MTIDTTALRADLVQMLMNDRQNALQERNAGAAVQASSRVVDLMLGRLAEEAKDVSPIGQITHVVTHMHICIACRERLALPDPPPPEVITEAERRRVGGWDEPDIDPDAAAAEPLPAPPFAAKPGKPKTIEVPKTREQINRRRRDGDARKRTSPPVKGLC